MTNEIDLKGPRYKKLRAFTMHGAALYQISGTQAVGDCPFCLKNGHFYVNYEKMLWDCKVCGFSGNLPTFLEKINGRNKLGLTKEALALLAEDRKLPLEAFKSLELGYFKQYTMAVRDVGGKLVDLRIYKIGGKAMSTAGSQTGLMGLPEMVKAKSEPVYICEGEWDTIAMQWLLSKAGKPGRAVCSPGANTFKPEWAEFFKGREVKIMYDNDDAGFKGERLVMDRLAKVAKSLSFCHWPQGMPDGFDLRDFIVRKGVSKNTPKRCFRLLTGLLKSSPRSEIDKDTETILQANKPPEIDPSVNIQDVLRGYDDFLHEPNHMAIELALIIATAGLFETVPIWVFLVAPPASGKTQIIQGLKYLGQPYDDVCYAMSAITPHSLISGMETKRGDPSVFAKLNGTKRALIIKDFTTVTSMPESEKMEVNAAFRDSYDGYTSKSFGNGVVREYNSLKFSVLAGVTDDIYNESVIFNALGERFAKLNVGRSDDIIHNEKAINKATDSRDTFKADEDNCAKLVYSCVKNAARRVENGAKLPPITEELKTAIIGLSLYVAAMRGIVSRDKYRRDYIKSAPYSDSGIRFAKMIGAIASVRAFLHGREAAGMDELPFVKKISLDTINQRDEEILRKVISINRADEQEPLKHIIQQNSKYTPYTVHCVLEDLVMLKMLTREKVGKKHLFRISEKTQYILERAKLYENELDLNKDKNEVIIKKAAGLKVRRKK